MEKQLKKVLKTLKVNEGTISTVMGGVVVLVMGMMAFNYFKSINKTGSVSEEAVNNSTEETLEVKTPKELPATYKVVKGDDLWHIAENFYGSGYNFVDIARENKIKNPSVIEVGTELVIPKVEPKLTTKVKAALTAKERAVSIEGDKYTTVKGDYLWSIALRAYGDGYAWIRIYNANKAKIGKNPSRLFTGVELSLPR